MGNSKEKINVSILLNKYNYSRTLHPDDLAYLKTFANILNEDRAPEIMDEKYMIETLPGADVCITGWDTPKLTEEVLKHAPKLRLVAHAAGTPKSIVTDAVWKRGMRVFTAAPIIAIDVAETVLGAIIYLLKCMNNYNKMMRAGTWVDNGEEIIEQKYTMYRLNYRLTVGIIGASHVGRNLIRFLQPFGVKVLLSDPYVSEFRAQELGVKLVTLPELMSESDVVSLHAPNIPQTQNMINKEMLALMKDGALFVNTARAGLVEENALLEELKSGRINAYLDVFHNEPLPKDNILHKLGNVMLTPHISGGHTVNGGYERGNYLIQQIYTYHTTHVLRDETINDMLGTMG